jgi:maltose O-acetyltransferase
MWTGSIIMANILSQSIIRKIYSAYNLVNRLLREIIWLLSEIEALISIPNSFLAMRRLYLYMNQVKHKNSLWVGRNLRLLKPGNLILGERCAIGDFVRIANHAPIIIGDDFTGATGLHLDSGTHDPETLEPQIFPITIGDRVWCGINVTILAGVSVGNDVVLGAGSVVCKDIPSNSIAVGIPAKVIKPLKRDPNREIWTWAKRL